MTYVFVMLAFNAGVVLGAWLKGTLVRRRLRELHQDQPMRPVHSITEEELV